MYMHKTAELKEETDKYSVIILTDFSTPTEHFIEEIKYQQGYRRKNSIPLSINRTESTFTEYSTQSRIHLLFKCPRNIYKKRLYPEL